ncbi:MAG: DUF47 family protein [Ruminococcaceae bacterium]|nr:DUF47 family protein [Oscillospiraceae bacterium]
MSKKTDAFYFENLMSVAKICENAADYLVKCLTNYDPASIKENLIKMHEYEHSADIKKHEMLESLSKAFITPLEREDLAELSYNLDEVADNIEEVLQRFYMDEPKAATKESVILAEKISACCKALENMFAELHNFKKPEKLQTAIVIINDLEEECDKIYLEAYRQIKKEKDDVLEVIAWRKIYDYLEKCADACEHVADIVDMIVMKNT